MAPADRAKAFWTGVAGAAAFVIPVVVFAGAMALPYTSAESRKEWEPAVAAEGARVERTVEDKLATLATERKSNYDARFSAIDDQLRAIHAQLSNITNRLFASPK